MVLALSLTEHAHLLSRSLVMLGWAAYLALLAGARRDPPRAAGPGSTRPSAPAAPWPSAPGRPKPWPPSCRRPSISSCWPGGRRAAAGPSWPLRGTSRRGAGADAALQPGDHRLDLDLAAGGLDPAPARAARQRHPVDPAGRQLRLQRPDAGDLLPRAAGGGRRDRRPARRLAAGARRPARRSGSSCWSAWRTATPAFTWSARSTIRRARCRSWCCGCWACRRSWRPTARLGLAAGRAAASGLALVAAQLVFLAVHAGVLEEQARIYGYLPQAVAALRRRRW